MAVNEFEKVLDFILNKANDQEFEVIIKACERRRKDAGLYAKLGGMNPGKLASKMAESVQAGLNSSMDGLKNSVRDYVARIVKQKEPNASDEEIDAIIDYCLPDRDNMSKKEASNVDGSIPDLPPEALAVMVKEFYEYSVGVMLPSKQQELWESIPNWQDSYWKVFPSEVKAILKACLDGKIADDEMWSAILGFLGL